MDRGTIWAPLQLHIVYSSWQLCVHSPTQYLWRVGDMKIFMEVVYHKNIMKISLHMQGSSYKDCA